MKKSLEQLAKEIFNECKADGDPVTMEEAIEMAKMEVGAKQIKRYEQSSVEKKPRKPRERKVDEEKGHLLGYVKNLLEGIQAEIINVKTETEVEFRYNGNHYTFKLTKHRNKKK